MCEREPSAVRDPTCVRELLSQREPPHTRLLTNSPGCGIIGALGDGYVIGRRYLYLQLGPSRRGSSPNEAFVTARAVVFVGGSIRSVPITNGIGWSECTADKESGLGQLLGLHMEICQAILRKHPYFPRDYYYFDITAGSGSNDGANCYGSPVVFLQEAARRGLQYQATFIEKDSINSANLGKALWSYSGNHSILNCNHQDVLATLIDGVPKSAFGMIYVDPNGEPPFGLLSDVSRLEPCKRMDMLVYASASTVKRRRTVHGGKSLVEHMESIDKRYWLIRDHQSKFQWTFLLGTNWVEFPSWETRGFYRLQSEKGREILDELNWTKRERAQRQQMELPYATYDEYLRHPNYRAVRAKAVERSGGT